MKNSKFTGMFIIDDNLFYELEVYASGFLQAFILLTADAIRKGKHYQLSTIKCDNGEVKTVGDISLISKLLS